MKLVESFNTTWANVVVLKFTHNDKTIHVHMRGSFAYGKQFTSFHNYENKRNVAVHLAGSIYIHSFDGFPAVLARFYKSREWIKDISVSIEDYEDCDGSDMLNEILEYLTEV